jgi:hypothetical protein
MTCLAHHVAIKQIVSIGGVVSSNSGAIAGTCNENDTYRSEFRSRRAGFRASVLIQNNGLWTTHAGGFNLAWTSMSYQDNNSNSLMVLCADDGTWWYCGYLNEVSISLGAPSTFNAWRDNYGF